MEGVPITGCFSTLSVQIAAILHLNAVPLPLKTLETEGQTNPRLSLDNV